MRHRVCITKPQRKRRHFSYFPVLLHLFFWNVSQSLRHSSQTAIPQFSSFRSKSDSVPSLKASWSSSIKKTVKEIQEQPFYAVKATWTLQWQWQAKTRTKQEFGHGIKLHAEFPLVWTSISTEWTWVSQWSIKRTRKNWQVTEGKELRE